MPPFRSAAVSVTPPSRLSAWPPAPKRVRLTPPVTPHPTARRATAASRLPPLQSLKQLTARRPPSARAAAVAVAVTAELRRKYLDDISLVVHELRAVLVYGPGSACRDAPVSPALVLKLVRTVQTLEKLRALLLLDPARLRRVSLAQLETVEQQIKTHLLPLATLFRSFDQLLGPPLLPLEAAAVDHSGSGERRHVRPRDAVKVEKDWAGALDDVKSPRSPSGVTVAHVPRQDWRFLSMVLSLQL
ncbi:unnamed protein product [Hyaloperonospora brassicae]|uniref:Uncharacterized protein n=1 Tax=Hyaloperonospora brassicae TaxID=162125 RepID=A0AAV0T690_HYABA|nr:unnamed protein product [Hyaloperonospora brassicae]